jgi:DNA-binding response OmpR family regulator
VLTAVLARGYAPVEAGPESIDAVLATVEPQVAVMVVDPSRPEDSELIRRLAATDAFVLFLAPRPEFFPLGLAAGAEACLEDATVSSSLAAQLASAQRRQVIRRQAETVSLLPLTAHSSLDLYAHRLVTREQAIALTPFEFAFLETLGRHGGRIVSPASIVEATRGRSVGEKAASGIVKAYVRRLRRKFQAAGINPSVLRTVRGIGYMIDRDASDLLRD